MQFVGGQEGMTRALDDAVTWVTKLELSYSKAFLYIGNYSPPLYKGVLQRTNTENLKQIFPEMELLGLSPNFHIHVFVSDLYIPTIDLPILLQEIFGIYKSLTDTRIWNFLGLRPLNSQKRNT
jgi:hypothetical protein